jgi:hypothetical protein
MHLRLVGSLDVIICPIDGVVYRLPVICVMILSIIIPDCNKKYLNHRYNRTVLRRSDALSGSGR